MRKLLTLLLSVFALGCWAHAEVLTGPAPLALDADASGSRAWEKIYVLSVIYPKLAYSVRSGEMLSNLQKRYRDKGVEIYGIFREKTEVVEAFAAAHPEFTFPLCADPELESLKPFLKNPADAFSRTSILNKSGKLLWSGDPIDLEMMLKRITEKRYSEREEIRMSALVDQLQASIHAGALREVVQCADRILAVRPEQLSAFNAKAYALEQLGAFPELTQMLKERIARHPDWPESYFLLLDAGYRIPLLAGERTFAAESYLKNFPDDVQGLNGIAWSLLNNAPFDAEALLAVRKVVKRLEAIPSAEKDSKVLVTRALLAYRECDLTRAKSLLVRAVELTGNAAERRNLESLQKYLEAAGTR